MLSTDCANFLSIFWNVVLTTDRTYPCVMMFLIGTRLSFFCCDCVDTKLSIKQCSFCLFCPDNPETVYKHTKLLLKLEQYKEAALNWLSFRGIQLHRHKGDLGAIKKALRWADETHKHILVPSPTDSFGRRGLEADAYALPAEGTDWHWGREIIWGTYTCSKGECERRIS